MSQKAPFTEHWIPENVNNRAPGQAGGPPRYRGGGLLFLNLDTHHQAPTQATCNHAYVYTHVRTIC